MRVTCAPFRFDAANHEYIELATGETRPHITGMLEQTGHIDPRWYTHDSRVRGQAVHHMTADYDLGVLDVEQEQSRYRGYLLAHVELMAKMQPEILEVEQPRMHPRWRYGGRLDRVWRYAGALTIPEIKTGDYEKAHPIQTALQAILVELEHGLPAEMFVRMGVYLKPNGRAKVLQFNNPADFIEARKVIKCTC